MRRSAVLLLVLLAGAAGAAEIYTWKDRDGRVNYADNPPSGSTPARTLSGRDTEPATVPASQPAAGESSPKSVADQDLEFRKRQAEAAEQKAKAAKEAAATEEKQKNCERASNQLKALESGQRVAQFNAKGEREFLDDEQRAQAITNAKKVADSWCK
jgi:hypothetical protein